MQIWCNVEAQTHTWESRGQNVGEKVEKVKTILWMNWNNYKYTVYNMRTFESKVSVYEGLFWQAVVINLK